MSNKWLIGLFALLAIVSVAIAVEDMESSNGDTTPSVVFNGTTSGTAGTVVITGVTTSGTVTSITIGDEVLVVGGGTTKFKVTEIADDAFKNTTAITSVTVSGKDITSIGARAFEGCTGLTSASVTGAKITSIGASAFEGCTGLISASITGAKIATIGDYAFKGCSKIATITLSSSVTALGVSAFEGCSKLVELDLRGVKTIGADCFKNCGELGTITFGSELTSATGVGKTFKDTDGTDVSGNVNLMKDHRFKALGETSTLTRQICLTFDSKGGSAVAPKYGFKNSDIGTLPTPTYAGYTFKEWCTDSAATQKFTGTTYTEDTKLYAKWEEVSVQSVKFKDGTREVTSIDLERGDFKTLTIALTPATASILSTEWTTTNSSVAVGTDGDTGYGIISGLTKGSCTVTVKVNGGKTASVTVNVTSGENHTVTLTKQGEGTITADKTSAKGGQTVTLTVTPGTNYEFDKLTSDPTVAFTQVSGKYTFTMPDSNITVNAIFKEKAFPIATSTDGHGEITGPASIERGKTGVYSIVASKDYIVKEIKWNGESKGNAAVFITPSVTEASRISVTFESLTGATSTKDSSGNVTVIYTKTVDGLKAAITEKYKTDGSKETTINIEVAEDVELKSTINKSKAGAYTGDTDVEFTLDTPTSDSVPSELIEKAQKAIQTVKTIAGSAGNVDLIFDGTTILDDSKGIVVTVDLTKYDGTSNLVFVGDKGVLFTDSVAMKDIAAKGKNVKVTLIERDKKSLTNVQKWISEDYPVFEIGITADGKEIKEITGAVTPTLPFIPGEGQDGSKAKFYYIAATAAEEQDTTVTYSASDKTASTSLKHLSLYFVAVDYKAPETPMPSDSIMPYVLIVVIVVLLIVLVLFMFKFDLDNKSFNISNGGGNRNQFR